MTGYCVKLTPKAEVDFDEIVAGIMDHAPRTVSQWYGRFRKTIDEIAWMPQRYPLAGEAEQWG